MKKVEISSGGRRSQLKLLPRRWGPIDQIDAPEAYSDQGVFCTFRNVDDV